MTTNDRCNLFIRIIRTLSIYLPFCCRLNLV